MPTIEEKEPCLAPRSLVVRRHPKSSLEKRPAVQTTRASQLTKPRAQRPVTTEEVPEFLRASRQERTKPQRGNWLLPLGIGMACALLLALVGSAALSWW